MPVVSVVVVVLVFVLADLDPQHFAVARRSRLVGDVQGTVLTDGDSAGKSQLARLELELLPFTVFMDREDRAVAARPNGGEEAVVVDLQDPESAVPRRTRGP